LCVVNATHWPLYPQERTSIIAGVYAGGAIMYTLFGTGDLQPWNSMQKKTVSDKNETETEKIPLRNNNV
jgi:hypothetical protein